ncbi:MAG: hypothetical protein ACOX1S_05525 [Anaerostipes sp.]|jgi:hypothetical protein|nr:hypothetical protein [Anaerostipes sp.]
MNLYTNIVFLIIFTVPASIYIMFQSWIRFSPRVEDNKSLELAECFIVSTVVLALNYQFNRNVLMSFLEKENPESVISFLLGTVAFSIIFIAVWFLVGKKLFFCGVNIINKLAGRNLEGDTLGPWNELFEGGELEDFDGSKIKIRDCLFAIEKSGKLITMGVLKTYSAPHRDKEFLFISTDHFKDEFEEDKERDIDERLFQGSICEYYNVQNDVLIKVYSLKRYDKRKGN